MNCSTSSDEWIRSLPKERKAPSFSYSGIWIREGRQRAAVNSAYHSDLSRETIRLYPGTEKKFEKTYLRTEILRGIKTSILIKSSGVYEISGNWLLLHTLEIETQQQGDGKNEQTKKKFDHKLLYYYSIKEEALVPMLYEQGYIELNYGIKDGVREIYNESDENFHHFIHNFTVKEYHSHAYFQEK
ncbi:MAG: hypothetical protein H7A25_24000 [Leptospiraceae bacterium]|nr:hypothetical protein [Leptospiraceae bacterium]MCP5502986.1 hypothetical protein [Leptospiraceae bacterium]